MPKENDHRTVHILQLWAPALAIFMTLFATYCVLNARHEFDWVLDLNRREYGNIVFTTTGAMLGIMTILATSEWMAKTLSYRTEN